MRIRTAIVALAAMTIFAIPSLLHAQKQDPAAPEVTLSPSRLLAQRDELKLTPHQVSELSLLSAQVYRYQRAVLLAPSKPWIAGTRGTTAAEASQRAFRLLSPEQREVALRVTSG